MRTGLAIGVMVAALLGASGALAQEGLTRRDSQGPVTVAVTLAARPALGAPVEARIVLDTHSVGLDAIAFDKAVALRLPDGSDLVPTAVETQGSGHHRQAVVRFPPLTVGPLTLVVKDVGGVAERAFVWEVPAR